MNCLKPIDFVAKIMMDPCHQDFATYRKRAIFISFFFTIITGGILLGASVLYRSKLVRKCTEENETHKKIDQYFSSIFNTQFSSTHSRDRRTAALNESQLSNKKTVAGNFSVSKLAASEEIPNQRENNTPPAQQPALRESSGVDLFNEIEISPEQRKKHSSPYVQHLSKKTMQHLQLKMQEALKSVSELEKNLLLQEDWGNLGQLSSQDWIYFALYLHFLGNINVDTMSMLLLYANCQELVGYDQSKIQCVQVLNKQGGINPEASRWLLLPSNKKNKSLIQGLKLLPPHLSMFFIFENISGARDTRDKDRNTDAIYYPSVKVAKLCLLDDKYWVVTPPKLFYVLNKAKYGENTMSYSTRLEVPKKPTLSHPTERVCSILLPGVRKQIHGFKCVSAIGCYAHDQYHLILESADHQRRSIWIPLASRLKEKISSMHEGERKELSQAAYLSMLDRDFVSYLDPSLTPVNQFFISLGDVVLNLDIKRDKNKTIIVNSILADFCLEEKDWLKKQGINLSISTIDDHKNKAFRFPIASTNALHLRDLLNEFHAVLTHVTQPQARPHNMRVKIKSIKSLIPSVYEVLNKPFGWLSESVYI